MKPTTSPDSDIVDADGGALLLPSSPQPSTVRVLIPHDCTWTTREVSGAARLDITITLGNAVADKEVTAQHGGEALSLGPRGNTTGIVSLVRRPHPPL